MSVVEVTGLNIVAVYVTDIDRAKSFYVDMLGFVEKDAMPPGVMLQAGDLPLYLEPGREGPAEKPMVRCSVAPCLAVNMGVKAAFECLKAAGVTIVEPFQEFAPTFGMFRIADPDGNVLEVAGQP